jgi:hypothetical protein
MIGPDFWEKTGLLLTTLLPGCSRDAYSPNVLDAQEYWMYVEFVTQRFDNKLSAR